MYYGGGQEELYSYATLGYDVSFVLVPLFLIAAFVLLFIARGRKTHKKLLYGLSIALLILASFFGVLLIQGKPRCCGEGYSYIQSYNQTS